MGMGTWMTGEATRVGGSMGGGRCTTGNLGDNRTDIGNGSCTCSGTGMVGDEEAIKRVPVGLGMKESDMVCWVFSSPINLTLYNFSTQF